MIKIFSDDEQLMRIHSDCRKENDSLNLESQSELGDPAQPSQVIDDEKMDEVKRLEREIADLAGSAEMGIDVSHKDNGALVLDSNFVSNIDQR